ncbi:MAG: hypothetical protein ABFD96_13175 [Armatimonadia bacterium]
MKRQQLANGIVRTALMVLVVAAALPALAQEQGQLETLMNATGLKMEKLEADTWKVPFDGDNGKTLEVYVTYSNDKKISALIFCTVVDRDANFQFNREVLARAMVISNDQPFIKIVLDADHGDLDCQTEAYMPTLTAEALKMYLDTVASISDQYGAELNQLAGQ